MTAKDHLKLIDAGFMIIRRSITPIYAGGKVTGNAMCIKYKNAQQREWAILAKNFISKAELQRAVDALLLDKKTVEE